MVKINAVVYDVDGTLINSEPLHVEAWKQALIKHGHTISQLSAEFLSTMAGKKPIVIAEGMVVELRIDTSAEQFLKEKTALFFSMAQKSLEAMPGAIESVDRLSEAGFRLAIGTSLDREFLDIVLGRFNIADKFEVIITGNEITKGKSDPETYFKVFEKLNLEPTNCVVLEDARTGVEAAKASGAFCIGVENVNAEPQDLSAADLVVQSLNEINKEIILDLPLI